MLDQENKSPTTYEYPEDIESSVNQPVYPTTQKLYTKDPESIPLFATTSTAPYVSTNVPRHPYGTSFYSQLWTLSGRAFTNFYRNFYLMPAHFLSAIVMGLLLGAIYWKLGIDLAACQNRLGSMFFMCCLLCFGAMSSLELFITERAIFVRERANGYYRPLAYFVSKTLFDLIPLRIFPPIIMGSIAYFMIGLRHDDIVHFVYFILILTLFNLVSGALCIMIGSIAPSVASGNIIATILILTSSLFSGFLLNKDSIPAYLNWIKYTSFWNYAFESLCINEFYGVTVVINPKGMPRYLADGNFWLKELGMDHTRMFYDVIILGAFAIGFMIFSCVLLVGFVKEKR
jgi:ABC-type multidrug transport system permease subunit